MDSVTHDKFSFEGPNSSSLDCKRGDDVPKIIDHQLGLANKNRTNVKRSKRPAVPYATGIDVHKFVLLVITIENPP